ncbi:hypothetical protein RRG08_012500 [Elysia crispata]|uniref:Spaetzle domain-containing protein n=1 Tax=Elysia crispata TaxID=231223 RepID=A0AAE1AP62_9GAST|nr:hypothetical protein RRG08_012500 [Elysia crispata]
MILGLNSRVIVNKAGEVIGIEVPAGRLLAQISDLVPRVRPSQEIMPLSAVALESSTILQDGDSNDTIFTDLNDLKASLGPNFEFVLDDGGQIIGLAANHTHNTTKTAKTGKKSSLSNTKSWFLSHKFSPFSKLAKAISKSSKSADDVSVCCSTREFFYFNKTLVDYYGRPQVIAQINEVGVYQLIRHGLCGATGACSGQCDQIYVTVPLVVHPTQAGQQVSFSLFKIPGYCTCRVRSSRSALIKNIVSD